MTAFAATTHPRATHATDITPGSRETAAIMTAFAGTLTQALLLGSFRCLTRLPLVLLDTILFLLLPAIGILGNRLLGGGDTLLLPVQPPGRGSPHRPRTSGCSGNQHNNRRHPVNHGI